MYIWLTCVLYIYIYIDVLTYEYIYICYDLCLSGHTECAVDHEQFERCLRALLVLRDAVASTECKGTGMKDIGHFHHFVQTVYEQVFSC